MLTKIQKWGNSLGLRIPKSLAEDARVEAGSQIDITLDGDQLVIRPVRTSSYQLDEFLSRVTRANRHNETSTGDATGRELW